MIPSTSSLYHVGAVMDGIFTLSGVGFDDDDDDAIGLNWSLAIPMECKKSLPSKLVRDNESQTLALRKQYG